MQETIEVQEGGRTAAFTFDDMLRYSGPGSPGGVALGFKLMEQALPALDSDCPVERREVAITTAFRGPGVRDACELVTRALTDGRYVVDMEMERPDRGHTLQSFAFQVAYRGRTVSLVVRQGVVSDEFVALAERQDHTDEEARHFVALKQELADRLMRTPAADVFDVV